MFTTKSESTEKAFATFRVAGDSLIPDEITKFLEVVPTHSHKKGERFSTGKSTILPNTGLWLFNTDTVSPSRDIYHHLHLLLFIILGILPNLPAQQGTALSIATRLLRLKEILEQRALTAVMTLFWHGRASARYPKVPDELAELFHSVPISIEIDLDRDE